MRTIQLLVVDQHSIILYRKKHPSAPGTSSVCKIINIQETWLYHCDIINLLGLETS